MERWYYANKQCSWREYIEISGIRASLADNGLKSNRRKDIGRILLNKNKLKNLKPESVNLPGETNVFINKSLCFYYKKHKKDFSKIK